MRFPLLLALAVLAASIPHSHCFTPHGIPDQEYGTPYPPESSYDRPQEIKGYLKNKPNGVTLVASYPLKDLQDDETSPDIIQTLKELRGILKEKFAVTAQKIKAKVAELNTTSGERTGKVKAQLKGLLDQLGATREQLRDKMRKIFSPSQYYVRPLLQRYLRPLREHLQKFLKEVKDATGENLERLKQMIREIREEIKQKLVEGMGTTPASYPLKEFEDDESSAYIIQTLKELRDIFKKKFAVIIEKIEAKVAELNTTSGERAEQVKVQLKELHEQLAASRYQLRDKIREIFSPCLLDTRDVVQIGNGKVAVFHCNCGSSRNRTLSPFRFQLP